MYPVASQNRQDFHNLVSVYLDAVFKPFLTPETLQNQGWHYETDGPDAPLTYKGVVFNEMKGVYSSPDSLIGRFTQQSLFPDNVYSLDSGGDPAVMPDLTYEQFRSFHRRYYHPSNATIVFYGDDHSDERLRMVDAYLSEFEAAPRRAGCRVAAAAIRNAPFCVWLRRRAGRREQRRGRQQRGRPEAQLRHDQLAAQRDHRRRDHAGLAGAVARAGRHAGLAAAQGADRLRPGRRPDRRRLRSALPPGHLLHRA